jgi:hypothetical protein
MARGIDTFVGVIPWTSNLNKPYLIASYNRGSYVETSMRLTRYRNYSDRIL